MVDFANLSETKHMPLIRLVTDPMLEDKGFADTTLLEGAAALNQLMKHEGAAIGRGALEGEGSISLSTGLLGDLVGVQPELVASYGISEEKMERTIADLNKAFVLKMDRDARTRAYNEATLHGKLDIHDSKVNQRFKKLYAKYFHSAYSRLYSYERDWLQGRRTDQYGADHLVGDIKDAVGNVVGNIKEVLPYLGKESKEVISELLKGSQKAAQDFKEGAKDALNEAGKGVEDALGPRRRTTYMGP